MSSLDEADAIGEPFSAGAAHHPHPREVSAGVDIEHPPGIGRAESAPRELTPS